PRPLDGYLQDPAGVDAARTPEASWLLLVRLVLAGLSLVVRATPSWLPTAMMGEEGAVKAERVAKVMTAAWRKTFAPAVTRIALQRYWARLASWCNRLFRMEPPTRSFVSNRLGTSGAEAEPMTRG
ncbi:unnamed protein product, partial [Sphacelaria rigidula]